MIISEISLLNGRNIYSHKSVVRMIVDLEDLCNKNTKEFEGFNENLLKLFPGFSEHFCGLGHKGGFIERLQEGTFFGHVLEHLVLELQALLGYAVYLGKTRLKEEPSTYYVIFEYSNSKVAIECAKEAVNLIQNILGKVEIDLDSVLNRLMVLNERYDLGPSTKAIYEEARKRKIPVRRLGNESILELGYGKYSRLIQASVTDSSSSIAVDIACNKELTKLLLAENNIPVPLGGIAYTMEEAVNIADDIGYPVVLKPLDGNQGKGVVLNIKSASDLKNSYEIPMEYGSSVLVEKFITGRDYRVLVIGGKVSAVAERIPPCVTGDGTHTIKELIDIENKNHLRGNDHTKPLTKIALDNIVLNHLKKENLDENSIPISGQKVRLRENGNLSTGGSAIECTGEIHPENAEFAINAARSIGLDIAGIDIITSDIAIPLNKSGGCVVEVNAAPGLRMHLSPGIGKSINVAADILDLVYPPDTRYSIPIVAITGTNGKTTTTRLIKHALTQQGKIVGMTTTSGIYIGDKCILKGDNTGPISAQTVLRNKTIDAAVLEVARGGIIKRGLGYDLADVAIITNISNDHIGLDGVESLEDLAFVKSLVIEAVKNNGYAVINADDLMAEYFIDRVRCKLILFSKSKSNKLVKNHIKYNGIAIYVKNSAIYINSDAKEVKLIEIKDIPITFSGILECNIENALAAASALFALKVPKEFIIEGFTAFKPDLASNPGRFNVFDMGKFKVMIDYGHNIGGFEEMGKFIRKLKPARLIGVIGIPGDRKNDNIIEIASKCGELFSKVYIREDLDLRDRKPGEVADIMFNELQKSNKAKDIEVILSETEALKAAISQAKEGDFIIHFYEELEPVMEVINEIMLQNNKKLISGLSGNVSSANGNKLYKKSDQACDNNIPVYTH